MTCGPFRQAQGPEPVEGLRLIGEARRRREGLEILSAEMGEAKRSQGTGRICPQEYIIFESCSADKSLPEPDAGLGLDARPSRLKP